MRKKIYALLTLSALFLAAGCGGGGEFDRIEGSPANGDGEQRSPSANYKMPDNMDSLRPRLAWKMAQVFNDSNRYQYAHAEMMGIGPIRRAGDAFRTRRPVVKVTDNRYLKLDRLTHSVPFLVPEAYQLLQDIGRGFEDSLKRRHLPPARLKVTSLLRTAASVKRLRRVNRNATDSSTHQFATTFDISYAGYWAKDSDQPAFDPNYRLVLAEVLYDLRAANRCMVKYERHSPCFHITVIK